MVITAAVLLLIASFLNFYDLGDCGRYCSSPSAWSTKTFPALPSIFLAGIIAAALIVGSRFVPARKVLGISLEQWGTALSLFAAWTALWTILGGGSVDAGAGQILGLLAALLLAGGVVAAAAVPALQAPLVNQAGPQAVPGPYGAGPGQGYGYPGGPQGGQPYGAQQPYGGQPQPGQAQPGQAQPGQAPAGQAQPAGGDFAPFWFAVPVARPLFPEDGSGSPIAELTPGTWYLAVEQRGAALVAQTQDGRRGVLQDTSGIQRG